MPTVDDELTRRLRRAERPVDDDVLFEALARRRSHRERIRKLQTGMLAFAVLAATAGGFVALREAFVGEGGRDVGESPVLAANGEIVFSRALPDGSEHLFAVQPGVVGERLITSGSAIYRDPSVAPDGQAIAVVHSIPSFSDTGAHGVIATLTMDGGEPTWITDPLPRVADPAWSPEGDRIAFAGATKAGLPGIYVMDADGSGMRLVVELDGFTLSSPDWSPDGRSLVFVGIAAATSEAEQMHPDLYTIGIDGSGLTMLTETRTVSEWSPVWSPEGDRIAYHRNEGDNSNSIKLIDTSGRPAGTFFEGADAGEIGEVDWSPDGRMIAFTSSMADTDADTDGDLDVWTTSVGGTRLVLANLTTDGASGISWQPIPRGAEPDGSATPEPGVSLEPETAGHDIGLGVAMCDLEVLRGIDWDGTGIDGAAWTGAPVDEDGRCSSSADVQHVVAVDRDGDGVAEQGSTSTLRSCLLCRPFDTVDLNGDGLLELVVLEEASSTPTYSLYEVNRPGSERALGVYPIFVVPPGAPTMNLDPNEPTRFMVGGDEGFSGSIACENADAGAPILRYTWVRGAVDADTELAVDITRLRFGEDGVFHIESVDRFSVPRNPEPTDLTSTEPACGVDFHPDA
jgi:hypothetical protein